VILKIADDEKFPDMYLFEPFLVTNEGKANTNTNMQNDDFDYYRRQTSSADSSQVKLSTFLKLFVRVPDDIRLTKEIAKIDDYPAFQKKTDRKKLISYFFDDDLFDKMIEKFKMKNIAKLQSISKQTGIEKHKVIFDNFKIILKYVLFPNGCPVYIQGKIYKLQAVDITMSQIKYPPINSLRNIEGYLEESPMYEGRLTDTEVTDYVDKDDLEVDVEEYNKYRKEEGDHFKTISENVKLQKERGELGYYGGGSKRMIGGIVEASKEETTNKKNEAKPPARSRTELLLGALFEKDYKTKNRDSIKMANEKFVRKINSLYNISQITILLNIFESTDDNANSTGSNGINCKYHFAVARQLIQKIWPKKFQFDEISKKKNRIKRFKFIKVKEAVEKKEGEKEKEKELEGEGVLEGGNKMRTKRLRKNKKTKKIFRKTNPFFMT
jgi:hypothetical protein